MSKVNRLCGLSYIGLVLLLLGYLRQQLIALYSRLQVVYDQYLHVALRALAWVLSLLNMQKNSPVSRMSLFRYGAAIQRSRTLAILGGSLALPQIRPIQQSRPCRS